jgi:urate oxidase / 2-oxo-4-hydroxy-4-carboxy-5-ureidoimidazoline decarboxylase
VSTVIHYGKSNITLYRTYAAPLSGITPIPESSFVGRDNILFALDVDVEVFGDNFLPAYTEGDNSMVVATDSMKNFTLGMALEYPGSTIEGYLAFLGRSFLTTYPQMEALRLTAREQPFSAVPVPDPTAGFCPSPVLLSRRHDDQAYAQIELDRGGDGMRVTTHRSGQIGLQLIKLTGSSFSRFVRDQHTTLPERIDRPLFMYLDVYWRYAEPADLFADTHERYVAAEQVRDLIQVVFHQFVSESIQHLLHEMGRRLLDRFPQLAAVSFDAQNRLWDTAVTAESDPKVKVYCDPRPPYGMIHLTLDRSEH